AATAPPAPAVEVSPATGAIVVDGRLDEPAWEAAAAIALPFETWPADNAPARVATVCRLTWDERALLIGCRAEDPDPAAIRARYSDRDDAFEDDFVGVRLDPFDDRRRAFEFLVNPLGVQMDLFLDDLGAGEHGGQGVEDETWDAIWASAGRITPAGYEIEMAIPFSSLRFPRGDQVQTWGVSFQRIRPREHRYRLASETRDRDLSCNVCQLSRVHGFRGLRPGHAIELDPTATAARTDTRRDFPAGELESGGVETELGLTAAWGVTPNLILNAALNPDFSQVEADALQLDVNERFALFFPERRPFFLEGADFFTTPFRTVFTRNVADPDWGLKLSGKHGANAFGAFVASDDRTTLLVPGSHSSETVALPGGSDDAVLRYRRDVGRGSSLGLLATSRTSGGYENRVGGLDGLVRLGDADVLRFQALGSRTDYPDELAAGMEQPAGRFDDEAWLVSYEHLSRRWRWSARYEDVGRGFRADLGFLPQVDRRYGKALVERHWWAAKPAWWTHLQAGIDSATSERQDGELLERLDEVWFVLEGVRELELFVQAADRTRTFAGERFEESFVESRVELRVSSAVALEMYGQFGDEIDFANVRPGRQQRLEPSLRLDLGRHLRAELGHAWQRLEVDEGRLFEANLSELRLIWQFDVRTLLRAIVQRSHVERDPALYLEPVEAESQRLFGQLLFSFKLNPQTVFFLGYSETELGTASLDLLRADRTLFAKLGYAWSF
ncbi:MAG: carbohydrate binding family 9 domain-containing protein, partial [Thermoanaerobaculia bacterium]